ncbi:MAG: hypothetical protein LBH16_10135 [Treponema sp.]|jgi:hypothetical protein|nr:hypothetical protein [Treponema sp.]
MKRALFFTVFLVLAAVFSFSQEQSASETESAPAQTPSSAAEPAHAVESASAQTPASRAEAVPAPSVEPETAPSRPSRSIFFDGSASKDEHLEFFLVNFKMEAEVLGYNVAREKSDAGYIFKFKVEPNMIRQNDGTLHPAPADDSQFVILISLIRNTDDFEILYFNFYFTELLEVYEYTQMLFLKAAVLIPPGDPVIEKQPVIVLQDRAPDTSWRDKLFYIRLSFDYSLAFYILQGDGLIGGQGVYYGDFDDPYRVSPLEHKILPMPGFTAGVEGQFFNFFSMELNAQFSFGDTRDNTFLNAALGTDFKFPLKFFKNFVIAPYAGLAVSVTFSDVFDSFPIFAAGGGIQFGVKSGKNGSIFTDIRYLYSIGNAGMVNPYGELFPMPEVINYRRHVLGFSLGYKYGFITRRHR